MKSSYLTFSAILSVFGCSTSFQTDLNLCEYENELLSTEAPVIELSTDFNFDNEKVMQESYSGGKPFNGQFNLNNNPIVVQTLIEGQKETDNIMHPTDKIFITVNNEGFLFDYSKQVSNDEFTQSLKRYTKDYYQSNEYRTVIYDINWTEGTSENRKEKVLTSIIKSYLDLINEFSTENFNKPICSLTWAEMHQLRQEFGFAFWVSNKENKVIEEIPELEMK